MISLFLWKRAQTFGNPSRTKDDGAMEWLHLADANELNKMLIDTSFEFVCLAGVKLLRLIHILGKKVMITLPPIIMVQ